jgi:hypothetical protein
MRERKAQSVRGRSRILLVNPPVYDFSAYAVWMKPYGLLEVAGFLRGQAEFTLFDFMDRQHGAAEADNGADDVWGRGKYRSETVQKPACFSAVPRHFKRFGVSRDRFRSFLAEAGRIDAILVQTGMTYWYPGVAEVIGDLRELCTGAMIAMGGPYSTLCPGHAMGLGADLVVRGDDLLQLERALGLSMDRAQPALWEAYSSLRTGVIRLSDGCPFRCTYCAVPGLYGGVSARDLGRSRGELQLMVRRGVRDVAFYDDALLWNPDVALGPFLEGAAGCGVRLHTPNALNARLLDAALAERMVACGVKTFWLGLESVSGRWQEQTGGKVGRAEVESAVARLLAAGASRDAIAVYAIVGHPDDDAQRVEDTIELAGRLGVRISLSEYSPVPGTRDGERCRKWVDLDEPLQHNKTAFAIRRLGWERVQMLKKMTWNVLGD